MATQGVVSPMTAKDEEAIIGQFGRVLASANLSHTEAQRIIEQLGHFVTPRNLMHPSFAEFIETHRKPYLCLTHERIPDFLRRFALSVRRTEKALHAWYPAERFSFNPEYRRLREEIREGSETNEYRAVWVGFHVHSSEILDRVLGHRGLVRADFWEMVACAEWIRNIGKIKKVHHLNGASFGFYRWNRPMQIERRKDGLGGLTLVRVAKKA